MAYIFYAFTSLAMLLELSGMLNSKKHIDFYKRLKQTPEKRKDTKQNAFEFFMLFYLVWLFVGLFTSQWFLFCIIWLLCFVPGKKNVAIHAIDCGLTLLVLFFIIINRYHLHITFKQILHAITGA